MAAGSTGEEGHVFCWAQPGPVSAAYPQRLLAVYLALYRLVLGACELPEGLFSMIHCVRVLERGLVMLQRQHS